MENFVLPGMPVFGCRYKYILVMTFKRRRRANTAMPANIAMLMFLTSCETEMHI